MIPLHRIILALGLLSTGSALALEGFEADAANRQWSDPLKALHTFEPPVYWVAERRSKKAIKPLTSVAVTRPSPTPPARVEPLPPIRLNFPVGAQLAAGPGGSLIMGAQAGYPVNKGMLYVGPEIDFALFSPGSLISVYASVWKEWALRPNSPLSVTLGALAGPVFTTTVPGLNYVSFAIFLDSSINRQISDYATIKGQFRPGVLAGSLAMILGLGVSFVLP